MAEIEHNHIDGSGRYECLQERTINQINMAAKIGTFFKYCHKIVTYCPEYSAKSSTMQVCKLVTVLLFSTLNICLICSLICVNNITSCIPLQRGHSALSRDIFLFPIYKVVLPLHKFLFRYTFYVDTLYTTQKKLRVKGNFLIIFVSTSSLVWTSFLGVHHFCDFCSWAIKELLCH